MRISRALAGTDAGIFPETARDIVASGARARRRAHEEHCDQGQAHGGYPEFSSKRA
jgi:hypothetical protein